MTEYYQDPPELQYVPPEGLKCQYCGRPAQRHGPLLCGSPACRDRFLAAGRGSVTGDEYKTKQDEAGKHILEAQLKRLGWDRRRYIPTAELPAHYARLRELRGDPVPEVSKTPKNPGGRPSLGLTPEKISAVLARTRSIEAARKELKCSRGTIYGYIGKQKVKELTK